MTKDVESQIPAIEAVQEPTEKVEETIAVKKELTQQEKDVIAEKNKIHAAKGKLKEMWELFQYLESMHKGRSERRQFRRDFISNGAVMGQTIKNVVAYYEALEKTLDAPRLSVVKSE